MTLRGAMATLARLFRLHLLVFAAAAAVVAAIGFAGQHWQWAAWPMLAWSILLLIHYLLYKSMTVDERWAAERVEELNLKSYDRSHIESIRARQDKRNGQGR